MNDTSTAPPEHTNVPRAKPFVTQFDIGVFAVLIALEVALAFAWYQSRIFPYHNVWSDSAARAGGRTISADGKLWWQRCDIKKFHSADGSKRLPFNVVIGSNPNSERTPIQCGDIEASFAMPNADQWFAFQSAASSFSDGKIEYAIDWQERGFTYPSMVIAVALIFFVCAAEVSIKFVIRKFRRVPR